MYGLTAVGATAVGIGTIPLQFFTGNFITLAIAFFLLAIVAAVLGARGVAGLSMEIAKWLVLIFLVLAVASLVL
ncbi:DUF1328 domain-containing protein [Halosimplex halophilum]|uniref:DUF1328 domain-containing protein n=1 Tax=Halosimplex halophilum TaxID=2559572 RepID=UPI00107FB40A|nr:DUF1328 domain-containing protein [Halosimplex halophilum]